MNFYWKRLGLILGLLLLTCGCGERLEVIKFNDTILRLETRPEYTLAYGLSGVYVLKGKFRAGPKVYQAGTGILFNPQKIVKIDLNDIYVKYPELGDK